MFRCEVNLREFQAMIILRTPRFSVLAIAIAFATICQLTYEAGIALADHGRLPLAASNDLRRILICPWQKAVNLACIFAG